MIFGFTGHMLSWVYIITSPSTGHFQHIDKESAGPKLKANLINNILQADDGRIWISTDHGGISVLDKKI
jgi:ligand-binding sensor domain-containing protein